MFISPVEAIMSHKEDICHQHIFLANLTKYAYCWSQSSILSDIEISSESDGEGGQNVSTLKIVL